MRKADRGRAVALALGIPTVAYAGIAAGFHPFTWPIRVATAIPILVAVVFAARAPSHSSDATRAPAHGTRVAIQGWLALLVLTVGWELIAYVGSPRSDHPTLSSMAETVMSTQLTRACVFVAWLAVAWPLFVRPGLRR